MIFKKTSNQVNESLDNGDLLTYNTESEICFAELEKILLSEIRNTHVKYTGLEGFLRSCKCRKCMP